MKRNRHDDMPMSASKKHKVCWGHGRILSDGHHMEIVRDTFVLEGGMLRNLLKSSSTICSSCTLYFKC